MCTGSEGQGRGRFQGLERTIAKITEENQLCLLGQETAAVPCFTPSGFLSCSSGCWRSGPLRRCQCNKVFMCLLCLLTHFVAFMREPQAVSPGEKAAGLLYPWPLLAQKAVTGSLTHGPSWASVINLVINNNKKTPDASRLLGQAKLLSL